MAGHLRSLLVALAVLGTGFVGACTGPVPLYSRGSIEATDYSFTYDRPASRSDQVVYRELRLRLPHDSAAATALQVNVSSYASSTILVQKSVGAPSKPYTMIVSARVTVTRPDGSTVFSGQRTASASYQYVGQVLADKQAETEAVERASVALAETIRLTILSALAR